METVQIYLLKGLITHSAQGDQTVDVEVVALKKKDAEVILKDAECCRI